MFIHTNEKPYECDMCDYRSRQKQLLKRHINFYHTPGYVRPEANAPSHECEECHKKFIHIGNLIKHLAIHDPESNVHEEKNALKLGRKKRVKKYNEPSNDVIALPQVKKVEDFDDDEAHIVVFEMVDEDEDNPSAGTQIILPVNTPAPKVVDKVDPKEDMQNCFGFDEEEDVE